MKKLLLTLFSSIFLFSCGKTHTKEFLDIEQQASAGNSEAQYQLGRIYDKELYGEDRDLEKAAIWFEKAALQSHPKAQFNIADMYAKGEGVDKDIAKAIYFYELSANQGFNEANYNLGTLYIELKRLDKAAIWLQKAVDKGHLDAMNNLALVYLLGVDGSPNIQLASQLLKTACQQGNPKACESYNKFIK